MYRVACTGRMIKLGALLYKNDAILILTFSSSSKNLNSLKKVDFNKKIKEKKIVRRGCGGERRTTGEDEPHYLVFFGFKKG